MADSYPTRLRATSELPVIWTTNSCWSMGEENHLYGYCHSLFNKCNYEVANVYKA